MGSNKGQALIEFILILPIFLVLLLGVIDFGFIMYEKNRLEGIVSDAVDLVNNGILNDEQIQLKLENNYDLALDLVITRRDEDIVITLNRKVNIMTPGLNKILSNPFIIEVSRVINNE